MKPPGLQRALNSFSLVEYLTKGGETQKDLVELTVRRNLWQMNFSVAKRGVTVRQSGVCWACMMPNLERVGFARRASRSHPGHFSAIISKADECWSPSAREMVTKPWRRSDSL